MRVQPVSALQRLVRRDEMPMGRRSLLMRSLPPQAVSSWKSPAFGGIPSLRWAQNHAGADLAVGMGVDRRSVGHDHGHRQGWGVMQPRRTRQSTILASIFVFGLGLSSDVFAADHLRGVITNRESDGSLTVQSDDATNFVVVLTEATKVRQESGIRRTKMGTPALIPGLRINAEGQWDTSNRFVAEEVYFTRTDFRMARAIQAGLVPTDQRVGANKAEIDTHTQLIQRGAQRLDEQGRQIAANDQKIVATAGRIDARIAALDNYNVISTITVHFRNNKAYIDSDAMAQLQQFASQAKGTPAYMVQVEGYASAVGPESRNQTLSADRAGAVTAVLQQHGVPSTNMLVPAAMGTSEQVASNKTKEGQAENRRAVIKLLQNKGIAGQ